MLKQLVKQTNKKCIKNQSHAQQNDTEFTYDARLKASRKMIQ
jgi:hypothetical protein